MLRGVTPDMLMSNEETFGPVAAIQTFATEDEGVATANDTPFGLSGYFYSRDIGRVWRVAEALETGSSASTRPDLDRGGAVRRHQGIRDRP